MMKFATDIELVWLFDIAEPVKVLSAAMSVVSLPYYLRYQYR